MKTSNHTPVWAVVWNLLLLYVAYGVTRLAFLLENLSTYDHVFTLDAWSIVVGGLYFDTSAIAYTNALYILMVFLPCHLKETGLWQRICKWIYIVINALGLAMNLGDSVYFQYTARRTTMAFFSEFGGDDKLGTIVGYEFLRHWYLVLLFVVLMVALYKLYRTPKAQIQPRRRYYVVQTLSLLVAGYLCWAGMRGGLWDSRPIKISTANQFIIRPNDASLILNTPFSMLRTIGKNSYIRPAYYTDEKELESIFTPIHQPDSSSVAGQSGDSCLTRKNVVVIFLESFGREYFGSLNRDILPGYKGYTTFLDSLIDHPRRNGGMSR